MYRCFGAEVRPESFGTSIEPTPAEWIIYICHAKPASIISNKKSARREGGKDWMDWLFGGKGVEDERG